MPPPSLATVTRAPASAVTFSATGTFATSAGTANQLAVVKQNVLELWSVAGDGDAPQPGALQKLCEPLVLNAPPVAMMAFRPPGRTSDCIAMAFTQTHLSIVAYNEYTESIDTVAAVLLLDEAVGGSTTYAVAPFVRYDEDRHLLSVFFCSKWLAIVHVLGDTVHKEGTMATSFAGKTESTTDAWGDEDDDEGADAAATLVSTSEDAPLTDSVSVGPMLLPPLRLATPILIDCTQQLKRPLRQVRDVQFVPSFSEPTLAVLCEQESTWAGRVKLADYRSSTIQCRSLSCSIVWLSLSSIQDGTCHAVEVGDIDGIPYSATHLMPIQPFDHVPGGVLCFSHHSILHVTPKRRFGCYFNKLGREEAESDSGSATNWSAVTWITAPERSNSLMSSLRCAFLTDRALVVCTTTGSLLCFAFESDGRSVVGSKCSVLGTFHRPSCLVRASKETPLFFIGTTEGESAVIRVATTNSTVGMPIACTIVDRMRRGLGCIVAADLVDATSPDPIVTAPTSASADAPNSAAAEAPPPAVENPYLQLTEATRTDADVFEDVPVVTPETQVEVREIAVCTGVGAAGAVVVCRDAILPDTLHRNNIECIGAFTIALAATSGADKKRPRSEDTASGSDFFLLLATRNATIVLQGRGADKRLVQVKAEDTAFATNARTLFGCAVLGGSVALQVTERDVMVVSRDGRHAVCAHMLRPCGVTWAGMLDDGTLLVLYSDGGLVAIVLSNHKHASLVEVPVRSGITAVTSFVGTGSLDRWLLLATTAVEHNGMTTQSLEVVRCGGTSQGAGVGHTLSVEQEASVRIDHFTTFPAMVDTRTPIVLPVPKKTQSQAQPLSVIHEMKLVTLRSGQQKPTRLAEVHDASPTLFVLTDAGECIVYKVVLDRATQLPARFLKKAHDTVDAERRPLDTFTKETIEEKQRRKRLAEKAEQQRQNTAATRRATQRLIAFDNIRGLAGVYVCGRMPRFYFSTGNNIVVSHRHIVPGGSVVRSLAPMHAEWIREGFVCCCEGFIAFHTLPLDADVLGPLVTRRVELGATPHRIAYCTAAHSMYVVASTPQSFRPVKAPFDVELRILFNEDGSVQSVTQTTSSALTIGGAPGEGVPSPTAERYRLMLLSTAPNKRWETDATFQFDENEEVLCSELIAVPGPTQQGHDATPTALFAVGTAYPLGEDVACRGRLILFRTCRAGGAKRQLVTVLTENTKGPVTALTGMLQRYIVAAVGGTIKVLSVDWSSKRLAVCAFLFSGLYVPVIRTMHSMLLLGDLHRSCTLARFNEEDRVVEVLARHSEDVSVVAANFSYRGGSLGFIVTDAERNVLSLGYQPLFRADGRIKESRLTLDGACRIPGGSVSALVSMRCFAYDVATGWLPQNKLLYCTNYGEVGFIIPVNEQDNRAAHWLSKRLSNDVAHGAALPPALFQGIDQTDRARSMVPRQRFVDVALLHRLWHMSTVERRAVCTAAGTQVERTRQLIGALDQEASLQ